jgi:hypothetical protein
MVGEEPFGRISNEIPIMNQKQDLWPNMNISKYLFSFKYLTVSKKCQTWEFPVNIPIILLV